MDPIALPHRRVAQPLKRQHPKPNLVALFATSSLLLQGMLQAGTCVLGKELAPHVRIAGTSLRGSRNGEHQA